MNSRNPSRCSLRSPHSLRSSQYYASFIFTNTFAFHLSGFLLFLNTFAPFLLLFLFLSMEPSTPNPLRRIVTFLITLQTFCLTLACTIHKRHLMMPAIWAPAYAFQGIISVCWWVGDLFTLTLSHVPKRLKRG